MPKKQKLAAKERKKIRQRLDCRYVALRKKYPEVHGKVLDFITHTVEDGALYFTVRFTDETAKNCCRLSTFPLTSITGDGGNTA